MTDDFEKAGENLIAAGLAGMYLVAHDMMIVSQAEVPVDTDTLRDSARIILGDNDVTIGYGYGAEPNPVTGKPASDYAIPVHEILEAKHAPPTKAKYLEDPVMQLSSQLGAVMGFFMAESVGSMSFTAHHDVMSIVADFNSRSGSLNVLTGVHTFGGGKAIRGPSGKFVGST